MKVNEEAPRVRTVLYISYDGMTDQLGQSQVLPYLIGLSKYGYKFHLISCEKPERFAKSKHIIEKICSDNGIIWHPVRYRKSPPVLSTLIDVRSIFKKSREIFDAAPVEMIHCRGYISGLIGLKMKKQKGLKFLFDMRGLWADEKVDAGTWRLSNPIFRAVFRYFKRKERAFFENADYSVSLTHAGKKEIHSWKHLSNNPVRMKVIPCCADLNLFSPLSVDEKMQESIRKELGISAGEHLIAYLGSIGGWYMLEEMLDFFTEYSRRYPASKFLFISMDHHDLIRLRARERGIKSSSILIRGASRSEVAASLSLCRHSVFFIRPTYSKISSSPTKQAELMGMGIPVICNDGVGDTGVIVSKYSSGIAITDFNNKEYVKAIDKLSSTEFDSNRIRAGARDYFSLEDGIQSYLEIYQEVLT
ncbi:MAG: glycosyltransferase [Chitinophagaceae bacterium]